MKIDLYTDGGAYNNGTPTQKARICVFHGTKMVFHESIGSHTSNEAEFIAIGRAFDYIATMKRGKSDEVRIFSDSKLAVNMVNKKWKGKLDRLKKLRDEICLKRPERVSILWIPREKNNAGIYLETTREEPVKNEDNLVGLANELLSTKSEIGWAIEFFKKYQWSSIADGWKTREYKLVAVGVNQTTHIPQPISFTDLEEYDKMSDQEKEELFNGYIL